jgi:hypothetical protein
MHADPDFVLKASSGFQRQLTLPSGKTVVRGFKPGELMWTDAHSHEIGEHRRHRDARSHQTITPVKVRLKVADQASQRQGRQPRGQRYSGGDL